MGSLNVSFEQELTFKRLLVRCYQLSRKPKGSCGYLQYLSPDSVRTVGATLDFRI